MDTLLLTVFLATLAIFFPTRLATPTAQQAIMAIAMYVSNALQPAQNALTHQSVLLATPSQVYNTTCLIALLA